MFLASFEVMSPFVEEIEKSKNKNKNKNKN